MSDRHETRAELLEELAEFFSRRSETLFATMQSMTDHLDEYTSDDIARYGAYSAEAQSTAMNLRIRAHKERNKK